MTYRRFVSLFNFAIGVTLLAVVVGVPLAFSSMTRSVFEVNKLLILRYGLLLGYWIWIVGFIFKRANGWLDTPEDKPGRFGFSWKKIGLEIPIALWLGTNIISTLLSQNLKISVIGCYDRWEGIITIINYVMLLVLVAKLVTTRRMIHWILGGMVVSTVLSGIYGIFQSLGMDFMMWSVDPTQRVFACINNPVHYCAYVAMVVPVAMGLLLWMCEKWPIEKWWGRSDIFPRVLKGLMVVAVIILYYNQFLSYSRATWLGSVAALTLFYLVILGMLAKKTKWVMIADFAATGACIAVVYLWDIFNLNLTGLGMRVVLCAAIAVYGAWSLWMQRLEWQSDQMARRIGIGIIGFPICFWLFLEGGRYFGSWYWVIGIVGIAIFTWLAKKWNDPTAIIVDRIFLIILFAKLQFLGLSWSSMAIYAALTVAVYFRSIAPSGLLREQKTWLTLFLIIFGVVIALPTLPARVSELQGRTAVTTGVVKNAELKVTSYAVVAIQGTARSSMWKSAIPWIKDYWMFGTGPDTIKFMYPKYRRVDYGILEGGHNFTPDRLHNEYLNTLATRGVVGFLIYYCGVIVGWFGLALMVLHKISNSPYRFIVMGLVAGVIIYLGQVLFNFGVVATLTLFYVQMGLGLAFVIHRELRDGGE